VHRRPGEKRREMKEAADRGAVKQSTVLASTTTSAAARSSHIADPVKKYLDALHKAQACDAISRTKAGEPGHSILQADVPDGEDLDCEPSKRRKYRYSPASFLSCFLLIRPSDPSHPRGWWRSARPRGRPGSASTLVCLFPSCNRLPYLSLSAPAIGTSLTCTGITSTPARSIRAAGRTHTRPS
jgi:hypothetical protein